jgi:hypothetical protein
MDEVRYILCEHNQRHGLSRELYEIEAESVASIVAATCGLSTLDHPYPTSLDGPRMPTN